MRTIEFRRKREGRTDYKKRIKTLVSRKVRLVARISNKNANVQFIEFTPKGDKIVASASSKELKKLGWNYSTSNTPAAYLIGYIAGTKAKKAKIDEAIFDIGLTNPMQKSKIFAMLKGAVDSGLNVPHSDVAFPSEDRINGKHIEEFAKANAKGSQFQFKEYEKVKADPKNITKVFGEIKSKIK